MEGSLNAWLVVWEWAAEHAALVDRVAAILNPRLSVRRVGSLLEWLYVDATSNASSLAEYAKNPRNLPYRAQIDVNGIVRCGGHPCLIADRVTELAVASDPATGLETITWVSSPRFELAADGPRKVRDGLPESVTRLITGPLSRERKWDRVTRQPNPQITNRDA